MTQLTGSGRIQAVGGNGTKGGGGGSGGRVKAFYFSWFDPLEKYPNNATKANVTIWARGGFSMLDSQRG